MDFLDDYVVNHFSSEEKYMRNYDYPGYQKHKAEHSEFMEIFSKLKGEMESNGPALDLVVKTNQMVVQWLIRHIGQVDRALGIFLTTRQ